MAEPDSAPPTLYESALRKDRLFGIVEAQDGLFTTQQAGEAGYSDQLLVHHVNSGNFRRVRRGIYRLVHYPMGENEEFVEIWLWSDRAGVFSHDTALALHDLSDVLPTKIHLTLPSASRRRRRRVPDGVVLHHADVMDAERAWHGPVPITSPLRTLVDCACAAISPEILEVAVAQALRRGLITADEAEHVLVQDGGLAR
jgi:predicted transcriptional regulator of viral defense system